MAAPLLIGTDIRKIKPDALEILLNKEVIAVDQDPLGVQGKQVSDAKGVHVIVKPLEDGSRAVAVFNEADAAQDVAVSAKELGLQPSPGTARAISGNIAIRRAMARSSCAWSRMRPSCTASRRNKNHLSH
jgi:hypothetical protein